MQLRIPEDGEEKLLHRDITVQDWRRTILAGAERWQDPEKDSG